MYLVNCVFFELRTLIPVYLMYNYQIANVVFALIVFSKSNWNGANFYVSCGALFFQTWHKSYQHFPPIRCLQMEAFSRTYDGKSKKKRVSVSKEQYNELLQAQSKLLELENALPNLERVNTQEL